MDAVQTIYRFYQSYGGEKRILGASACGLPIVALFAGRHEYPQILVQYGIHGREWVTSLLAPAALHTEIVAGDKLSLTFLPKGFGSENMSRLYMLTPAKGVDGIVESIVETVRLAGSKPCPPVYVGVGIGGTFDTCAFLAKKALTREIGSRNPRADVAEIERRALEKINALGIGAQGFGGNVTALGVSCELAPTHIAGLPVAVNIQCHCVRCESVIL